MVRGRAWTGFEAVALQEAMRRSVRDFAALLGLETTTVNNWRTGLSSVRPRSNTQAILDTTFDIKASPEDRARFEQIVAEGESAWRARHQSPPRWSALASTAPNCDVAISGSRAEGDEVNQSPNPDQGVSEELIAVLARVQKLSRSINPDVIDQLRDSTYRTISEYETLSPAGLLPVLTKQRAWLEALIDECGDLRQRRQLFEIASETSGLLGYIAVGCASFSLARAYCLESYQLSGYAEDRNLMAWARGMQSFCEYYAGRYDKALSYAEDGFIRAEGGPQSVRLAINGVARARGRLGDTEGVHRAVSAAHEALSRHGAPQGVPSSISLGTYSSAQIAGNAATAYLSLAAPDRVEEYAHLALAEMSETNSPWGRSLVMIDMARAHVLTDDADLDAATDIMLDALDPSRGTLMLQVQRRGSEFVRDATVRWGNTSELRTLRDMLTSVNTPDEQHG